jgi:PAS domain S-box-containing protein
MQLADMVESSDHAIIGTDLHSKITSWNKGAERIFGYAAGEMIGTSIKRLIPEDRRQEEAAILDKITHGGNMQAFETLRQAKDGRLIHVSIKSSAIQGAGGEVVGMSKVERDMSEHRAMAEIRQLNIHLEQRVLERTAQLQDANRELEAFSYSVSHDLRAPLRHILGFVKLLQQEASQLLPETSLRLLEAISQSANRMVKLIDDTLGFARVGRAALRKTEVDLEELAREIAGSFQAETKERKVVWQIHPLPKVTADCSLLRLVLLNLLANAVKFTAARAEARIEIGVAPEDNGQTVIFIRDNGAGFDPLYAGKLFGVFQRLHSTDEFEGTGIGLANVRRIINRHGGCTWAQGAVGKGATFYFSIPKEQEGRNGT